MIAKREKVKREWLECQSAMTEWVIDKLMHYSDTCCDRGGDARVSLRQLFGEWDTHNFSGAQETSMLPTVNDLHVHINQLIRQRYVHDDTFQIVAYASQCQITKCDDNRMGSCGLRSAVSGIDDENGMILPEIELGLTKITGQGALMR